MLTRTIYLSRFIGLTLTIVAASMLANKAQAVEEMRALVLDRAVILVLGFMGTGLGSAIVVGHQIWRGGVLPIVVTIVGWILFIRGVLILILPVETTASLIERLHFDEYFYLYLGVSALVGLYLAISGFRARYSASSFV